MNVVKLSATLAVSQQIVPEHVAAIAEAGYKVLINNRPDGEEANQPPSAAIAAAAEAAGMEYYYMPITAMNFPGDAFPQMCELLANADKPVLAFCRTGTRCTNLWVASHEEASRAGAAARARELGYDLGLVSRLG
jgi:uncharacterized protein (TIGR01244 family)